MDIVFLLLLLAGALCFAVAVARTFEPKLNLIALGLLFWILVPLIQQIRAM
jgi:hypothetical protein